MNSESGFCELPLMVRPEPPVSSGIVDYVALDGRIFQARGHGSDPARGAGADVPHIVQVILRKDDVVVPGDVLPATVRFHRVAARVAHLKALHADVVPVDLEAGRGAVVLPVDDRPPAVRGSEYDPSGRGAAARDGHDLSATRVDAVVHDHRVAWVRHVGGL